MNNTKVALLRGINVGGHKKFPKVGQLTMLADLDFKNPQVYLHTGNWVFTASESNEDLANKIEMAITKTFGWEVPVLVFDASEIEQILNACPFSEEKKLKSYFVLLKSSPFADKISEIEKIDFPGEVFHLTKRCVYFFPEMGAGKAKLSTNFFENKLNVTATARNYNTLAKILKLTTSSES
jgi:uncharacterized protein (DUF1697 family)|tara:strand:- start:253 stop:795 length:543 start_codon:yes stop_codon:yes gene_type:complete